MDRDRPKHPNIEHRPHMSPVTDQVIQHDNGLELFIMVRDNTLIVSAVMNGMEIYHNDTDVIDKNSLSDMRMGFYAWSGNPQNRPPGVTKWPPIPLRRQR